MALFSPFFPWRNDGSLFDHELEDHPFLNMNSSFFRDANIARSNRANVSETENEYHVEVEVPGYQKPEINIEFGVDGKSLTISGKSETSYEERPNQQKKGVTVEEVPEEGEKPQDKPQNKQSSSTAVAQTSKDKTVAAPAGTKYWISERTKGSFSRTFTFRSSLDAEKATAKLEHGILTVVIPKAQKAGVKKISIA